MRPKVVIPILLIGALAVVMMLLLSEIFRSQPTSPPVPLADKSNTIANAPAPFIKPAIAVKSVVAVSSAPAIMTNDDTNSIVAQKVQHEEFVQKRADELMKLAMENSPDAHQQIVNELTNSDKAIRQAALEALEQADDRSVVPQMQQIENQTDDPDEKAAIQDAIDFINLPSLTEYLQQKRLKN